MSTVGSAKHSVRPKRVLVVDDTPDVRLMMPLQLEMPGVSFAEAASGVEALERCGIGSFDLIVLDFRMPGLTGLDVARKLRSGGDPTPIVIYSAYVDQILEAEAKELGVTVVDKAGLDRLKEVARVAMGAGADVAFDLPPSSVRAILRQVADAQASQVKRVLPDESPPERNSGLTGADR